MTLTEPDGPLSAQAVIRKKRDGRALNAAEIRSFVSGVTGECVSDAQIAAFAMAVWIRGMESAEQQALTAAIRDSGSVLTWRGLDGPVLDKHSSGGIGDLVSLVLGPMVAACGGYVPMISGRGLGHTGGTLDKLESIPGFETALNARRLQKLVAEHGIAIVGQTLELAPADRRIYAVRDVTATVDSTPLIVSSILGKKLAEGLDALVLDIKFGSGSFTPAVESAQALARSLAATAGCLGLSCSALLTSMDEPLAPVAGNALEVREAIRMLRCESGDRRALDVSIRLAGELLWLGGLAADPGQGEELATRALLSGAAAERFARMVHAQGGPGDLLERPAQYLPTAACVGDVAAEAEGNVASIDARAIGSVVVGLGGGRQQVDQHIDHAVGISNLVRVGQRVAEGTPLARVYAATEHALGRAAAAVRAAVTLGAQPERSPLVLEAIRAEQ